MSTNLLDLNPEKSTSQDEEIHPLLKDIHLNQFLYIATTECYTQAEETIAVEGEIADKFYIILEGEVEVLKKNIETNQEFRLTTLKKGDYLGESAFFGQHKRMATLKTLSKTTLLTVDPDEVREQPWFAHFMSNLAQNLSKNLSYTNDITVAALSKELEAVKHQNQFGQFFIYILISFVLATTINELIDSYFSSVNLYTNKLFNWTYLMLLLVPAILTMWRMEVSLAQIGVTRHNWRQSLIEGLLASLGFLTLFITFIVVGNYTDIITLKPFSYEFSRAVTYFLHSCVQELLSRGILQSSFQRLFNDQNGWKAIILTSILFGVSHVILGLPAILITFIASIGLGWFYHRHQNLLGVCLLHGIGGMSLFGFGLL